MSNPTIEIFDALTGENISREMTDAEWKAEKARRESNEQIAVAMEAERLAKEIKKQEVLAKLGLTPEEAQALLG